ncbi:hypothetical protein GCM10020221_35580 [Streptomyces thioluteus]|uniref:Major facilitator superfamily (MFS) profile domain-containing protein n=1 Tax=Streptomyces thioluteus TaxID=66431 RepID=A0ABN3X3Z6_STRTU
MVAGSVALGAIFVFCRVQGAEPIIPLRLFRNKTIALTSAASLFVGVAMFASTVFLSQYFQLSRGETPTMSGVMTIPLIAGLFISSTVSGNIITRNGRWKAWLLAGGVLLTAGIGLLGSIRHDTPYGQLACYMALMGLGLGMMMQNLVLAAQNQVAPRDLGAASSVVTFFRSLGGAVGVSALGAVMATRVKDYVVDGLTALGPKGAALAQQGGGGGSIPEVKKLPEPLRSIMEDSYGHGVGDVFAYAAPTALIAFLLTLFIKEVALKGRPGAPADANAPADQAAEATPAKAG